MWHYIQIVNSKYVYNIKIKYVNVSLPPPHTNMTKIRNERTTSLYTFLHCNW